MNENHAAPPPAPTALCAAYAPQLALLDAGMLEPDEERGVRAHAATCAWCQAKLAIFAIVDDALRRNFSAPANSSGTRPAPTLEAIVTQSEHEAAAVAHVTDTPDARRSRRPPPAAVAAACAAALVVLAAVVFVFHQLSLVSHHPQPSRTNATFALPTRYAGPQGPVVGPDGNIWFVEIGAKKIGRITPEGVITEFKLPPSTQGGSGQLGQLIVGPDGNLWFGVQGGLTSAGDSSAIGRITPAGVITYFPLSTLNIQGTQPNGITFGPDGNLWFTATITQLSTHPGGDTVTEVIGRMTPQGAVSEFALLALSSPDEVPGGITVGPDGNLWFTVFDPRLGGTKAAIGRISPTSAPGDTIRLFPLPASGEMPGDIVSGPDGNLWFTEAEFSASSQGNGGVVSAHLARITPDGVVRTFPLPGVTRDPVALALGKDDNFWVCWADLATGKTDAIARITPTGAATEYPLPALSTPTGIVWGPDGAVWITELHTNAIARFYPPS
jgi:virginiamycin B lyase